MTQYCFMKANHSNYTNTETDTIFFLSTTYTHIYIYIYILGILDLNYILN